MIGSQVPEVLRIQPVAPEQAKPEDTFRDLAFAVGFLFLAAWLVMLAIGNLHDLAPVVPSTSYWQTFSLLLGLNVVTRCFRPAPWKWARR